jgi:hypothetical protein
MHWNEHLEAATIQALLLLSAGTSRPRPNPAQRRRSGPWKGHARRAASRQRDIPRSLHTSTEEWMNRKERLRAVRPDTIDGYRNDLAHMKVALPKVHPRQTCPGNRAPVVVSDRPRPDRWAHTANARPCRPRCLNQEFHRAWDLGEPEQHRRSEWFCSPWAGRFQALIKAHSGPAVGSALLELVSALLNPPRSRVR